MKNFFFIIMMMCSITIYAHKINNYKFVYIEEAGNLHGIEKKLSSKLSQLGFHVISSNELEDISKEEKTLLLIVTYDWIVNVGAPSTLKITFTDNYGTDIYKVATQGNTWTEKGDMSIALNKLSRKLEDLHYKFNANTQGVSKKESEETEFSGWTDEQIMQYLDNNRVNPIEGIYKTYTNLDEFNFKLAILQKEKTYYAIVFESGDGRWKRGETKMTFNYIDGYNGVHSYDVLYFDSKGKKQNTLAKMEGRVLTVGVDLGGEEIEEWDLLKVYPSGDEGNNMDSNITQQPSDKTLKSTGSGFVVSGNVIATNFHVVNGASKITVTLTSEGVPEEYNARVLSVDKTNDLALVTIKDERFKPLKSAPYKIATKASDVGTSVFTMGYPITNLLGEEMKITDGIISAKTGFKGSATEYQISAPIQPGNSGGALFDKSGNLVGITSAGLRDTDIENVNYAIKTNYLLNLIDSAPIDIELPKGENLSGKTLPELIKAYKPYVAVIKVY